MSGNPFGGRIVFWGLTGLFCISVFSNLILLILEKFSGNMPAEIGDTVLIASMAGGALTGAVSAIVYEHCHPEAGNNLLKEVLIILGMNLLSVLLLILEYRFS